MVPAALAAVAAVVQVVLPRAVAQANSVLAVVDRAGQVPNLAGAMDLAILRTISTAAIMRISRPRNIICGAADIGIMIFMMGIMDGGGRPEAFGIIIRSQFIRIRPTSRITSTFRLRMRFTSRLRMPRMGPGTIASLLQDFIPT